MIYNDGMINIDPLMRQLAERGLSLSELSQLTQISLHDLSLMQKGKFITEENLNTLCKVLNCQPCDIIEFTVSDSKGHWEWIDSTK